MRGTVFGLGILSLLLDSTPAAADEWWGRDKALHGSLSFALAATGYAGSANWLSCWQARAGAGFAFAFTLGLAKEGYDLAGYGDPSAKDLAWDAGGALLGAAAGVIVDLATRSDGGRTEPAALGLGYRW